MQRLECHFKDYAWGKKGSESEVARLFAAGHPQHEIQAKPYAELWMGTHPDGPARVQSSSENLSRLIARHDCENNNTKDRRDEIHLPFIMKIMSIKHTLSLQVHPTKEQAAVLHERNPVAYPDRHHKPELAYALTRFELLCGFRPAKQILENMNAFPELRKLMGEQNSLEFERLVRNGVPTTHESVQLKSALRRCFTAMLYAKQDLVSELLKTFYKKLACGIRGALVEDTIPVLESMRTYFPNDVGCFSPLYLNHMILQPGECCFYAAEELHAYLSGECVECVGCSNNTIRAALTPKFVDKEALIEVLNYRMTEPEFYLVPPQNLKGYPNVTEYAPDCKDFTLHQIEISESASSSSAPTQLPPLQCASIMVIVEGEADTESSSHKQCVSRGDIFYIAPNQSVSIVSKGPERLLAYRTFSYEVGPDHSNRKITTTIPAPPQQLCQRNKSCSVIVPEAEELKLKKKMIDRPKFGLENAELFNLDADMDGLC